MMLLDMIRTEQPQPCFGDDPYEVPEFYWSKDVRVFDIQEVADYVLGLTVTPRNIPTYGPYRDPFDGSRGVRVSAMDRFGLTKESMACVRPPYGLTWMEFDAPDYVMTDRGNRVGKCGVMFGWVDLHMETTAEEAAGLADSVYQVSGRTLVLEDVSGVLVAAMFMNKPGKGVMGPLAQWVMPLDSKGSPLFPSYDLLMERYFAQHGEEGEREARRIASEPALRIIPPRSEFRYDDQYVETFAVDTAGICAFPALVALNILHTRQDEERGYTLQRHEPTGKVRSMVTKGVKLPMVHYEVLKIGGLKRQMAERGETTLTGVLRALHEVRGHYKHYRRSFRGSTIHPVNGRPLSDENEYVMWVSAHERGSADRGRVEKTYRVRSGA